MKHVNPPNIYAQEAGIELGLTQEQVLAPNFGFHTIYAIKAEIQNAVDLQKAFQKYTGLNSVETEGIRKLGLTRNQVLAPNFEFHTIYAIEDIQKRTNDISVDKAFELVKGKSSEDAKEIVNSYLKTTAESQKPINELDLIRVFVDSARGFGHQRSAITMMQKLREMGFKGTFDIQCRDRLGQSILNPKTMSRDTNNEPLVSRKLKTMIPAFESSKADEQGIKTVSGLGAIKISSLPNDYQDRDIGLPKADLAICAADDWTMAEKQKKKIKIFNASSYIGLEPTDWDQGSCFVVDQDGIVTNLPSASVMRLSSEALYQRPDVSSVEVSNAEKKVLEIVNNSNINSQLVYGLYPEKDIDITFYGLYPEEDIDITSGGNRMIATDNLDESIEMQRIVEANLALSKITGKPSILLVPQKIALDKSFINSVKGNNDNIHFADITRNGLDTSKYKMGDVIIAHTGYLQQAIFDYLMLEATTLPPVIEGCNSREICESAGRPFIHGSNRSLKQYDINSDKQKLHTEASLCLQKGDKKYVPKLIRYMGESLFSNPKLLAYHKKRKEAFFKRPDACEVAFDTLGIKYQKSLQQEVGEIRKQSSELSQSSTDQPGHRRNTEGPRK